MIDFDWLMQEQIEQEENDCTKCFYNPKRTGEACNKQCMEDVDGMPLEKFILMFCKKGVEQ